MSCDGRSGIPLDGLKCGWSDDPLHGSKCGWIPKGGTSREKSGDQTFRSFQSILCDCVGENGVLGLCDECREKKEGDFIPTRSI